ncbi:amidohydrolase [Bacillus sp. FJAT-53711]|uniref:Amidohydrolase n=1 Tax=Bacillus yunxiaonensis TaxID=3127665 RepID=A0ABU8FPU9_9BACI
MADRVFLNGEVITVDEKNRILEAVAVKGNRIIAVGTNEEIKNYIHDNTHVINLEGKSLLPGFIDSHLHMAIIGTNKLGIDFKEMHLTSLRDLLEKGKAAAGQTPKGEWIRAWGFNENTIEEKRFPTRWELDEISTEHPIIVGRTCGHISVVNSKALELAGLSKNTPDPEGGIIGRDKNGDLNGLLYETAHMSMYALAQFSEEELIKGLVLASNEFVKLGITSIHDAGSYGASVFRAMQKAVASGAVKTRIYAMICELNHPEIYIKKMIDAGILSGLGNEWFRIGPAKVFTDGASTGPTIATREPYTSNPNDCGILYYSQEQLDEILGEAHEKGFQITAHAQGDRAIDMLLTCMERALEKYPRSNHRHRIEHAGVTMPDLLIRMKKLGVVPIPNPGFFYEFGEGYIKDYGERVNHMYPLRDFIDAGIIAAAASDSPVIMPNPLLGIHVAVNRLSSSGQEVGANQRVSILEAIKLFTWNGAYASFEETMKGSIEVGKLADLVVLDKPILNVPHEQIKDIQVELTMLDGEIVFQHSTSLIG